MKEQHWYKSHVRAIEREECISLLRTQKVGRIAFTDDSGPDTIPVNFALDGEDVLIATTGYSAMARAATGARVAFEVDEIDPFTESGWSVVIRGHAHRESPFAPMDNPPYPWAEGNRGYVIRIKPDAVTGRRLVPA
ncbi:pyridoxamine 5'-phosphate oxidase family protein [Nocardioides panacisoli]|uniref:Pyridoxamine 5'-phosphate oxidase family protein n=1 Tax=Nocardioides panacisoli TaxID=627624 RepID=A0ABP7I7X6_9ACTN